MGVDAGVGGPHDRRQAADVIDVVMCDRDVTNVAGVASCLSHGSKELIPASRQPSVNQRHRVTQDQEGIDEDTGDRDLVDAVGYLPHARSLKR
jgi:hypothetical protein